MNRKHWDDPTSEAAKMPVGKAMNSLPKIVFSRTLPDDPGWNARVIRDHLLDEVATLRRAPGKSMVMFGSANLMETFAKHDLIDEYRFMVNPLVMGGGLPLFRGGHPRQPMKLLSARALDNGVVLLAYVRDRA